MPNSPIALLDKEFSGITNEQLILGQRRLARLKADFQNIQIQISQKILFQIEECRHLINSTTQTLGDINAALLQEQYRSSIN